MQTGLSKIYLANFLAGLSTVASVIYTLFFLSHGISQIQIGQLFGVFMIAMSIFNIPTGAFADSVGHKASVVIGLFFHALSGLFFYFYPTFNGMMVGMLCAGLGLALQTGAWSSLTYEVLEKEGKLDKLAEVMSRAGAYFSMAAVVGSLVGAPIFKYAPRLPFLLFFICIFLSGIVVMQIKYHKPGRKPTLFGLLVTTKDGIWLTLSSQKLMGLMVLTVAMTTSRMLMNQNIIQPYQINIGIDVAMIGITAAIIQVIQTGVTAWAYKIANKVGYEVCLIMTVLSPAVAVLMMSQVSSLASLGFIFVYYAGQAFKEPIAGFLALKLMVPTHRATMASTSSVLSSVIVGLLLPLGGKTIDLYGLNYTLILLSVWMVGVGGMGIAIYNYGKK